MTASVEDIAGKTFDYVVIGGGTAGLLLAARLSEDPNVSVAVLEAGNENAGDPAILRPGQYGSHFGQPAYDWGFKTTAQKYSNGKQYLWNRGKGLGGSSSINFLCWTKPPAEDLDDIEKLGNPGWNWKDFQKYYHHLENFIPPSPDALLKAGWNKNWNLGTEGPLTLTHTATLLDVEVQAQQTMINMGIPIAPDPLGGNPHGVFFTPNTVDPKTYTRTYAATAFYTPNSHRKNLKVIVNAHVSKIITETSSTHSDIIGAGVEFTHGGKVHIVNVRKEVVLSAGALKSPHILELSGIGKRDVLESLKIPVQLDLPGVGGNVQEHMFIGTSWEIREDVVADTLDLARDPEALKKHIDLHALGKGIFTMGITGFAFVPLSEISPRAEAIYAAARAKFEQNIASYPPGLREQYKIHLARLERKAPCCELITIPGFLSGPNPPAPGKRYISVLAAVNHNFSRGTIHSISSDPKIDPAFDPHYFEEDIDLQTFVETVKFIREIPKHAPLKDLVVHEVNPGPNVVEDAQIADWVKECLTTTYHTVGSLSMLPREKGGVVDPKLKIYGTSNIRVADLSIVPLHFAAHPLCTAYAIGDKASEIIKGLV